MNKRKEIGVLGTDGYVQGNSVENNANNNRGESNAKTVQLQPPNRNGNLGAIPIEPGINDLPIQKGQTNVIKFVSQTGFTIPMGGLSCTKIVLKINGKNYTFLAQ